MLLLPRLASSNLKAGSWNAASGNRSPAPAQKTLLRQAFPGVFAFLLLLSLDRAARATERSVDFHFAPPEWQTAICFPDDPDKSLVDRNGDLLYHYGKGGREFGTRVGVIVDTNAVWTSQDLTSPRVPIVRTTFQAGDLEILQEAFAVPETSVNSPVKGTTETKATRKDMLLVRVKNNGPKARTLAPELVVDTTLAFKFSPEAQCIEVNEHECITSSLRLVALASGESARRSVRVADITVPAGRTIEFFILYSNGDSKPGERLTQASAKRMREGAVRFWLEAALPYGRIEVPDQSVQALIDSSIRNIWQAREIKKGLPAFQVGPTCYRGLWIVDGAFLLEAAALLGAGDQARSGVAYELTYQRRDGSIHVMDNYSKENGIVLWTCVRHAQLTQDKAWLEKKWPELERIALYIKSLRQQTITNSSPRDDGLLPAGFPDGGIGGVIDEYTNPYWNMAGLHSFILAAQWLGKTETAAIWQREYDDFMASFRRAAERDMKTDSAGHTYLPVRMDGQDLPQRGQWAFCHAVYPGQIFSQTDPLVTNMLEMLQNTEREGMVYGTGWDAKGIWNYFASFYAHAWLWQGNGKKAAQVLRAYANHAAPTLVWREEQSIKGQKFSKVGDMPHNWASAEFIRLAVHLLALDRGDELHLLEGLPPEWLGRGMNTRLNGVATPFGSLYMTLSVDSRASKATLAIKPLSSNCKAVVVHLPRGGTKTISPARGGRISFQIDRTSVAGSVFEAK